MITPKSLKYSHKKTCSAITRDDSKPLPPVIEKKPKATKAAALPPQVSTPQEPPPPVIIPLTAEERRKQALRAREERLTNLFMSTLKRQIK
jgi:hypothetical protein